MMRYMYEKCILLRSNGGASPFLISLHRGPITGCIIQNHRRYMIKISPKSFVSCGAKSSAFHRVIIRHSKLVIARLSPRCSAEIIALRRPRLLLLVNARE